MNRLETRDVTCPYCGEVIEVVIDGTIPQQSYIEDCSVCCRPISLDVSVDDEDEIAVEVRHEDE